MVPRLGCRSRLLCARKADVAVQKHDRSAGVLTHVTHLGDPNEQGDLSSTVAFSLLFVVPAVTAIGLWIILKLSDRAIGLGLLSFYPWVLVIMSPAIASALVAQWVCSRSGTASSTRWGFSIGSALITILFAVVAAAWMLNGGE